VLAPCVLPLLPVIIGSSSNKKNISNLVIIVGSLSLSVFLFTILLRTALRFNPLFANLDDNFWKLVAGSIIAFFGLTAIFPEVWNTISLKFNLQKKSDHLLEKSKKSNSPFEPVLLGLSLGLVFSSCSPTYFVIVGLLVAEADTNKGLILLVFYILGLALVMLLIGWLGIFLTKKLRWAANPNGWFKKVFGVILLVIGISIMIGLDKRFETFLLDQGLYDGIQGIENQLSDNGSKILN
jgi:cytochrome c-type biogenesis protein